MAQHSPVPLTTTTGTKGSDESLAYWTWSWLKNDVRWVIVHHFSATIKFTIVDDPLQPPLVSLFKRWRGTSTQHWCPAMTCSTTLGPWRLGFSKMEGEITFTKQHHQTNWRLRSSSLFQFFSVQMQIWVPSSYSSHWAQRGCSWSRSHLHRSVL